MTLFCHAAAKVKLTYTIKNRFTFKQSLFSSTHMLLMVRLRKTTAKNYSTRTHLMYLMFHYSFPSLYFILRKFHIWKPGVQKERKKKKNLDGKQPFSTNVNSELWHNIGWIVGVWFPANAKYLRSAGGSIPRVKVGGAWKWRLTSTQQWDLESTVVGKSSSQRVTARLTHYTVKSLYTF
jgi:hypothetical protein